MGASGILAAIGVLAAPAPAPADTAAVLREVEVIAPAMPGGVLRSDGDVVLLRSGLLHGMRSLGESDALGVVKMLPGFSTGSDYSSGVSVNGAALSHTSYSIDGTPVFFPFHFGGIFSTFVPGHFSRYRLSTASVGFHPDMRVGGFIEAVSDERPVSSCSGTVDVGLLSSAATLSVPVDRRTSVTASARVSYIDALCARLVDTDDSSTRYGLADANISVVHLLDSANTLKANFFVNFDKVRFADFHDTRHTSMRWGNALANLVWRHRAGGIDMRHVVGYSQMVNRLQFDMPGVSARMPASVRQASVSGCADISLWRFGYALQFASTCPQSSGGAYATTHRLDSWLGRVYASRTVQLGDMADLDFGTGVSAVDVSSRRFVRFDPSATYTLRRDDDVFSAALACNTQYLQQVGIADIGMSADFWLPPVAPLRPLRTYGATFAYSRPHLAEGVSFDAEFFARIVRNEADYRGSLLDVMAEGYDALRCVTMGRGFDAGCNITVNASLGRLAGWAGYSLAVGRRRFPDISGWCRSAAEPLHAAKVYGEFSLAPRLKLSTYFTLASGRVYTPVEAIYIIAGNILAEYGQRNSARLPAYHRLDVSATYDLGALRLLGRSCSSFVNFSLINAYGARNVEMQYFDYNPDSRTISLHRIYSLYRFLPSLSYTLIF